MHGISRARGSRKSSTAAVKLTKGDGRITVNERPFVDYFARTAHRNMVLAPFVTTKTVGMFDVEATCQGGGVSGQAAAMRMAVARDSRNRAFDAACYEEGRLPDARPSKGRKEETW